MDDRNLTRNKEYFDRGLKNVIDSFERAREWADLSNCLQKVKKQIEQNRGLPIPRQRDLAKRLAQCLNPEINVIHQLTLEVYKEVFEREIELMKRELEEKNINESYDYDRKSSIALFFSGLFNFYQFAAFEVKQNFLILIQKYVLKMRKELILSLPGFMLCMIPALEDQNGEILRKVDQILRETEMIVGTSEFYGEMWKAMLRTPRARLSAIKYLDKRVPKNKEEAAQYAKANKMFVSDYTIQIINLEVVLKKHEARKANEKVMRERMDLHDYFYFYYPNKSKLVINALIAGLSIAESQVYVNRGTLDFLISHMPINSEINSIRENTLLVEQATLAYTKKDFATLNKISSWLFNHLDEDDEEDVDEMDPCIITIVESQKRLYQKSMDANLQGVKSVVKFGEQGASNNEVDKLINNSILILLRIISDEQTTTAPILKKLSIHLIKFIKNHLGNSDTDLYKFKQNLHSLLETIQPSYKAVLESLAEQLGQEIANLDYNIDATSETQNLETLELISFAIFDLQRIYHRLLNHKDSKEYLAKILSKLLEGMSKISNNHQNLELIQPCLDVIDQILNILSGIDEGKTLRHQKQNPKFKESLDNFNKLYIEMSHQMIEGKGDMLVENTLQYKQELDTYKKYNNIMLKVLHIQNIEANSEEMPPWLVTLIQSSKTQQTKICLVAVEVFIEILRFEDRSNQIDGGSIMHIQRLIADPQNTSGKFSSIAMQNSQNFKKQFLEYLQSSDDTGNSHCEEIIENLWSILDKEIDTEQIVTQLKLFDMLVPRIFSDVVIEDMKNKQTREKKNRAIKKFTIFWKFTGQEYPSYKPFEKKISERKYLALHNMINFLEDTDPTLRLSCRSWLSQQSSKFNRIIDPLIEEFLENSNFKIHDTVIIEGDFETQYVIENFGKLRNIILNTQDDIIEYMIFKDVQKYIMHLFNQKFRPQQTAPQNQIGQIPSSSSHGMHYQQMDGLQNMQYMDILVEITLFFIRAEHSKEKINMANQSQKEDQLAESLTVNASACEFMELILKQVEKYSEISNKIAHVIIKPLIQTFHQVTKKQNYAMQVNIINLLDLILNHCNFQNNYGNKEMSEDQRKQCIAIFSNPIFIESLLLGLKCDVSFVRQKFIKFVEMLVPYLRKFTKDNQTFIDQFKHYIEKLIDCFCMLLKCVDVTYFSTSGAKHTNILNVVEKPARQSQAQAEQLQSSRVSTIIRKPSKDASSKGDQEKCNLIINQEADIVLIIGGLQCIVNTCLDIKQDGQVTMIEEDEDLVDIDEDERQRMEMMKKGDANKKTGFLGGLFGNGGESVSLFNTDYSLFADVRKTIKEKIKDIFISSIYCWNHLSLYDWNDYHFTRHGMFAYYQDDNTKLQRKIRIVKNDPGADMTQRFGEALKKKFDQNPKQIQEKKIQTLEESFTQFSNPIQKQIIKLLRPIAKKIPDQFIEGALDVWLKKKNLGNVDINRSYEKLIQMIVSVYQVNDLKGNKLEYVMSVQQVILSINKYIEESKNNHSEQQPALVDANKKQKGKQPELNIQQSTSETLLNSFLYAYLVYQPCMFDPFFDARPEEKQRQFQSIYAKIMEYFKSFKTSRNPFTVCWLFEILNVVSLKFNIGESRLDNRTKKEYHETFNSMLHNFSQIITGSFNIKFQEMQEYKIALPPTVYEFLWRYEYIAFKNTPFTEQLPEFGQTPQMVSNLGELSQKNNQIDEEFESVGIRQMTRKSMLMSQKKEGLFNMVEQNGSFFFKWHELKQMRDQKFEYQHGGFKSSTSVEQSIFKNMEILMKERGQLTDDYMKQSDFMEQIKFALRGHDAGPKMLEQTRFFSILTLKQLLCQILINLVGTGDNEKLTKSIHIVLVPVIQLMQSENKGKSALPTKDVMTEFVTDFFASIVERSHSIDGSLIKPYRNDIISLFNVETFFQFSVLNMKHWQKIMKYVIDGKPDEIFEDLMQKWNIQGGLFANNNTIILQKCYSMKRIAFIIFSCDDDEFQQLLDQMLRKMIEVFKQKQKNDYKQRLFLLFLTRVILIRVNFTTLQEVLRKLWPHLLNELISVFEHKNTENDKDSTDLTIEAIKLVELLSSLNIEDFQMNQWIFIIDGYGMQQEQVDMSTVSSSRLEEQKISAPNSTQRLKQKMAQGIKQEVESVDTFKTFIVRLIGDQQYSFYNVETPEDGTVQDFQYNNDDIRDVAYSKASLNVNVSASPGSESSQSLSKNAQSISQYSYQQPQSISQKNLSQRQAAIVNSPDTSNMTENERRLQQQAQHLQQSINDSNVVGNEFNRQKAESNIESDFIQNDKILKF